MRLFYLAIHFDLRSSLRALGVPEKLSAPHSESDEAIRQYPERSPLVHPAPIARIDSFFLGNHTGGWKAAWFYLSNKI